MIVRGETGILPRQMASRVTFEIIMVVRGWPGEEWTCHASRQKLGMEIKV